uniref:Uncharacterized protein n=1 Tax=Cacopsylla melanoneura TaxID=428564 RepID=A0A8D8STU1_9HEMI
MASGNVCLLALFVCSMVSLNYAVKYDEIAWNDIDPYEDAKYNLQNLTGKNLCDPNKKLCEVDAKDAIMKFFNGEEVRANCEDCPEHKNICWLRRKKMFALATTKRTVWEMQIWLEPTDGNRTHARFAEHQYEYSLG